MRRAATVTAAALLAVAVVATFAGWRSPPMKLCTVVFDNGVKLEGLPQAETESQIERGLSGRDDVRPGMLFAWSKSEIRAFWMKNTRADLSIAFIDEAGRVFQIEDMQAFDETPHVSSSPARYALELPQGDFERLQVVPGTKFKIGACG